MFARRARNGGGVSRTGAEGAGPPLLGMDGVADAVPNPTSAGLVRADALAPSSPGELREDSVVFPSSLSLLPLSAVVLG